MHAKPRAVLKADSSHTVRATKGRISLLRREMAECLDGGGYLSWSEAKKKYVMRGTNSPKAGLTRCPECGAGQLLLIRSRATRKRFVGCSNYENGCTASAPLLQRAKLRILKAPCAQCRWPVIIFRYSRRQKWSRQCINSKCPTRA